MLTVLPQELLLLLSAKAGSPLYMAVAEWQILDPSLILDSSSEKIWVHNSLPLGGVVSVIHKDESWGDKAPERGGALVAEG